MPCLNEESGVAACVHEARKALEEANVKGEVLVIDNGSADRSADLAQAAGARVVYERQRGYGNAYLRGFKEAKGQYIIIGDCDGTYDFSKVPEFLELLKDGYEFVNGSRTKGSISPGAMPFLHQYVGVPILSWVLNKLGGTKLSDAHCGMRGFTRSAMEKMELRTSGMEFASEMILQAARANLRIAELPIPYRQREGTSKLRTFSDGWRHLRFMLLYSPKHLFAIPGALSLIIGLAMLLILVWGRVQIGSMSFDIHYMVVGSLLALLGFQVLATGIFGLTYANLVGIIRDDYLVSWGKRHLTLERGLLLGSCLVAMGLGVLTWILISWLERGFGTQPTGTFLRPALLGMTLLSLGAQTIFGSFFLSLMVMPEDRSRRMEYSTSSD
jgi:hypothetical protein